MTTIDELEEELDNLFRTIEAGRIPTTVPFIEDPDALVESYVDDTIGELTVVPAATREDFEVQPEDIYVELSNGQLPTTLPSIEAIPVDERLAAYDQVIAAIRGDPNFPQEALQGLEEQEQAIKAKLREPEGDIRGALEVAAKPLTAPAIELFVDDAYAMAFERLSNDPDFPQNALDGLDAQSDLVKQHIGGGRIKDALKVGARGLAGPLIDETLDDLREELAPGDLLDLVEKGAEQNGQTKAEFLDDLDIVRDAIDQAQDYWIAILVMVVAGVFMAIVRFPHAASALRWPGMTSLMIGVVFLIFGLVMNYTLSDLFNDLIDRSAEGISSPIPKPDRRDQRRADDQGLRSGQGTHHPIHRAHRRRDPADSRLPLHQGAPHPILQPLNGKRPGSAASGLTSDRRLQVSCDRPLGHARFGKIDVIRSGSLKDGFGLNVILRSAATKNLGRGSCAGINPATPDPSLRSEPALSLPKW